MGLLRDPRRSSRPTLGEIKRRKVFKVAAVYAVMTWLIIQIIDVINEPLQLPERLDTVVILLLAIGFPIAMVLAWAFDLAKMRVIGEAQEVATGVASGPRLSEDGGYQSGARSSSARHRYSNVVVT